MTAEWTGEGPRFGLDWGGRRWTLAVDSDRPGLTTEEPSLGPVLALSRATAVGRTDAGELNGTSLVRFERRFDRVEATYAMQGWGAIVVRAAWRPRENDVVDLEVQIQAGSVDELKGVEVFVLTNLYADPSGSLRDFTARTSTDPFVGRVDGSYYLELIHPDDISQRTIFGSSSPEQGSSGALYGLFGYDLEKGVVLRGRLRGLWLPGRPDLAVQAACLDAFLRAPLPLGT